MNDHESPPLPPDEQRPPQLIPGRGGTRMVSQAALIERVVSAFEREHGDEISGMSPALAEATTPTDRRKLLRDIVQHVLAVESILIAPEAQAELLRTAYSEIFGYGPLDTLFSDPTVTTIALEGCEKVSVRRGHGELVVSDLLFEDMTHFRRVVTRLLRAAGAQLREDDPLIETGLMVEGRPVSLNLVAPPVAPQITVDLRVHPAQPPTLAEVAGTPQLTALLSAIARSGHGVIIVGEPESGKTTLLNAMLHAAGQGAGLVTVERAGELRPPDGAEQLVVRPPVGDAPGRPFGACVREALARLPTSLALDEVRADETTALAPLLLPEASPSPRLWWALRGPAERKRLTAALGILARRSDAAQGEALVRALYDRLPFVVTVRRRKDSVCVHSVAEWQPVAGSDYPDYVELMAMGWDALEPTGKRPSRPLDLPGDFWG